MYDDTVSEGPPEVRLDAERVRGTGGHRSALRLVQENTTDSFL